MDQGNGIFLQQILKKEGNALCEIEQTMVFTPTFLGKDRHTEEFKKYMNDDNGMLRGIRRSLNELGNTCYVHIQLENTIYFNTKPFDIDGYHLPNLDDSENSFYVNDIDLTNKDISMFLGLDLELESNQN